jgi:hypothetical protein
LLYNFKADKSEGSAGRPGKSTSSGSGTGSGSGSGSASGSGSGSGAKIKTKLSSVADKAAMAAATGISGGSSAYKNLFKSGRTLTDAEVFSGVK